MSTLCIIPCSSKKIWDSKPNAGPTKARLTYLGQFSKKCQEYAIVFYPDSWCILSAKHGFLWPDDIVPGHYNVSFKDRKTIPIDFQHLSIQVREKELDRFSTIVVLGGKQYVRAAEYAFADKPVLAPLSDCKGIGYMMGKLSGALRTGISL